MHKGLPVAGYTDQPTTKVNAVNEMKKLEETVLRTLDVLAKGSEIDQRWLAIGRTHIEQGFMAVNRSIFRPQRVELENPNGD